MEAVYSIKNVRKEMVAMKTKYNVVWGKIQSIITLTLVFTSYFWKLCSECSNSAGTELSMSQACLPCARHYSKNQSRGTEIQRALLSGSWHSREGDGQHMGRNLPRRVNDEQASSMWLLEQLDLSRRIPWTKIVEVLNFRKSWCV